MRKSISQVFRAPRIGMSLYAFILIMFTTGSTLFGQVSDNRGKNNPYSPSPNGKGKPAEPSKSPVPVLTPAPTPAQVRSAPGEVAFIMQGQTKSQPREESRSIVPQRTNNTNIVRSVETPVLPPVAMYKVGVGDVLFVNLKNTARSSGYYTVKSNGTIDYPLAGENIIVADQTTDRIEQILESGISLFPDPQVEVKVREYASHKITVSGLVENGGEKNLQREAIPLFVIRAESNVSSKATSVSIARAPAIKAETYQLSDANTDNVLIYPGNSIEFIGDTGKSASPITGNYFISGEIVAGGQKELSVGLTLYQAVVASGGAKGDPKKAILRRKNDKGMITSVEHNLRSIKDGKAMDPFIAPGDVIEIRN